MLSGKLDRRLRIERDTTSRDASGGLVHAWTELATVWGQALPLKGREFIEAAQFVAGAEIRFRIRWRADVTEAMRIVHDGISYDIQHIAEIGRREGLEILAKKP